jgi:hypothetical protein
MQERSELLAELTQAMAGAQPGAPLALRLCTAMVEILGLEGGAMTVGFAAPSRSTLCATDEFAERLEDLQEVLREGPSLDAHRLGRPLWVPAEELPATWPMLAQSVSEHLGPAYLLSIPMLPATEVLGVLTMYSREPVVPAHDLVDAQFLADAIGVAILGGFDRAETTDEVWSTRDQIDQAAGMVVAQLRVSPADALAVLRAHAFAHNTSLAAIVAQVLSRELDFRTNPDSTDESEGANHADEQ